MDWRRRIVLAAGLLGGAGGGGLLAVFFTQQGLGRASLWATVWGFPLVAVGTVAAVWALVLAVRASRNERAALGRERGLSPESTGTGLGPRAEQASAPLIPAALGVGHDVTMPIPYRYDLSAAVIEHASAVVGREGQVRELMGFSSERGGGYVLVEAPAGFGKTTLVADLWRRHDKNVWDGPRPDLIGFSVRRDLGDHTAAAFIGRLIVQLEGRLGRSGGANEPRSRQEDFAALWREAVSAARPGRPLLLVVDGLDEAAVERPGIVDLLPEEVPEYVHVIVTSRPSPPVRSRVPPHHPLRRAQLVKLPYLAVEEIAELLRSFGAGEPLMAMAIAVHEVTRGEPLLARCTAQDIALHGEPALASYQEKRPAGVGEYFRWQLDLLEADADDDSTWDALALLFTATGGLTDADLADALVLPVHRLRQALKPAGRFLIGRGRHELMHEELAVALAERLSPTQRRRAEECLLAWCRRYAEAGWPEDTPDYVLANVVGHVGRSDDYELAVLLVSRRRLELMLTRTPSFSVLSADTSAVLEILTRQSAPDIPAEIGTALAALNIRELAATVPPSLLPLLVATGETAKAEAYATLVGEPLQRCQAFQAIATALWKRGDAEQGRHAVSRAVDAALAGGLGRRSSCLEYLALALLDAGAVPEACDVVKIWAQERRGADSLDRIGPALVRHGAAQFALTIAQRFGDDEADRAYGLLAIALADTGREDQALAVADRMGTGPYAAELLAKLATVVADHDAACELASRAHALLAAEQHGTGNGLISVAAALARTGQPEQALALLTRLMRITTGPVWRGPAEWPESEWWSHVYWEPWGEWARGSVRRDGAITVANQAVRAGIEAALLAACAGGELTELVQTAVAVVHAHSGALDRARDLRTLLTTKQARVEVLLAIADKLIEASPAEAQTAARQALSCADDARAEVAVLLARAGAEAEAIDVAQAIPVGTTGRGVLFVRLAHLLGQLGEPRDARIWERM